MDSSQAPDATRSRMLELGVGALSAAAGVAGVALLLGGYGPVGTVLGGLVWAAGLIASGWLLLRERSRHRPLLAAQLSARLVVALGATALVAAGRPDQPGWAWAAGGLLLLAVVAEPPLHTLLSRSFPVASRLPGVPEVPRAPLPADAAPVTTWAASALGGLIGAVGLPAWAFLPVAAAALTVTGVIGLHAALALRSTLRAEAGVRAAVRRYKPEFVVYYAARHGAAYQLGMWLPYLQRLGRRFVVITRNELTVPAILELTDAPVLVPRAASSSATLAHLLVPTMRAAFYVQGDPGNLGLQRFDSLTHVWLNHGDSDKKANFSPQHATFDKVFVAGEQGVERYAAHGVRLRPDQTVVVGRPQIERIAVRDQPPPDGAPRTVLYAPTWLGGRPGTSYSSLHLGPRIVAALIERGCTVIFRPHPLSRNDPTHAGLIREITRRLAADRSAHGRAHVYGRQAEQEWDVPACCNASDALITDVSSVASDYLASGKPLAMVAIRQRGAAFVRATPMARVAYVIESDLSTLPAALDALLGPDPLAAARRAYRTHCLGDAVGPQAAEGFLRAARALLDAPR